MDKKAYEAAFQALNPRVQQFVAQVLDEGQSAGLPAFADLLFSYAVALAKDLHGSPAVARHMHVLSLLLASEDADAVADLGMGMPAGKIH